MGTDLHSAMVDAPAKPLPEPLPRRLNVGCGYDIREGFLNIDSGDRHNPDYITDVTDLIMLPGG